MKRKIRFNLNFINTYRCFFFLAIILFCGLFTKKFFTAFNIRAVTGNGSLVMWLGMGFTTCMIAGHMDLTAMHMSTMGALLCLGLHSQSGLPWALAILVAALSGVAIGLINGTLATKFEIPSFIVTLGIEEDVECARCMPGAFSFEPQRIAWAADVKGTAAEAAEMGAAAHPLAGALVGCSALQMQRMVV